MTDKALAQKVSALEAQVALLVQRLEAAGVPTDKWLSPQKVADLLGTSRDRVMTEIRMAEYARIHGMNSDLVYGTHYRKDLKEWKISDRAYKAAVLDVPAEYRTLIEVPKEFKF